MPRIVYKGILPKNANTTARRFLSKLFTLYLYKVRNQFNSTRTSDKSKSLSTERYYIFGQCTDGVQHITAVYTESLVKVKCT